MRNTTNVSQMDTPGLSPKKTLFIMVTVVGCIAILWPKVFHPMMFGNTTKQNIMKDHRGGTKKTSSSLSLSASTCCDVVLDRDAFFNVSLNVGEQVYRKHINLFNDDSLRQERPPHLRLDTIHPAMREKGRAIPATTTIPIIERAKVSSSPPRVVEGRPGPIPGMRPPLGAGSVHQAPQKTSSMGFIMPLYTVGIVAFFIYTIMKILFKKPTSNSPYNSSSSDPTFHKEVFGHEKSCCKRFDDCSGTKLVVTAIQGLLDAADEQLKIRENSTNLTKQNTSENHQQQREQNTSNNLKGHVNPIQHNNNNNSDLSTIDKHQELILSENNNKNITNTDADIHHRIEKNFNGDNDNNSATKIEHYTTKLDHHKKLEDNSEKTVVVLGMELTASCEGGQKWNHPPTPVIIQYAEYPTVENEYSQPDPQPIYLEGILHHESKILVSDSKIHTENVVDEELNGSIDEPAVVLSSKMTLSLINLSTDNFDENKDNVKNRDVLVGPDDDDDKTEIINNGGDDIEKNKNDRNDDDDYDENGNSGDDEE